MDKTKINLIHGDCLEGMKQLPSSSVDLVVSSPPYNLGINYDSYQDKDERQPFIAWCVTWAQELKRLMREDASFFLNLGAAPKNPLLPHQLLLALCDGENPLFTLQNTFHWVKSISIETRQGETISSGHFKPINSERYANDCHEYIFHLTKNGNAPLDRRSAGVPYADKSNISRWGHTEGKDKRCRGNNWFIPYETIKNRSEDRPHPATFPIALVEQCIRIQKKGKNIHLLDPFNGIGSSAIAALRAGIKTYTGFEIDEGYLETTRNRIANEKKHQQDLLL